MWKKTSVILNSLVSLLVLGHSSLMAAEPSLTYQIHLEVQNPAKASIEVDTSRFPEVTVETSRTLRQSSQPQVECLQTGGQTVTATFGQPLKCQKLRWDIEFEHVGIDGFDAARQSNAYSPTQGWHLLSEWNSLPRIQEAKRTRICVETETLCRDLPPATSPPLFLAWGFTEHKLKVDGMQLRVLTDQPELNQQLEQWQPALTRQLRYLSSIFKVEKLEPWTLVWLQRERSTGNIGGAAGSGIYLANVPVDQGKLAPDSLAHLLKISAHELIHFISPVSAPLWANESLAEYYARQSLAQTGYQDKTLTTRKQTPSLPELGLYQASRGVSVNQAYRYYGLFYTKGAAFWSELDSALAQHGASLSQYIYLLEMDWSLELPDNFVEAIVGIIGREHWDVLAKRYLEC